VPTFDLDALDNRSEAAMRVVGRFLDHTLVPWFDYRVEGLERIPEGPALLVGNHSSGLMPVDGFLFGHAVMQARGLKDVPYALAHEVALSLPVINEIGVPMGAIRASHRNANRVFAAGGKVLVFPGGDREAMRPHRRRYRVGFAGRSGFARLALRARVPIVPVVTAGAHSTMVILDDLPWLARRLRTDKWLRTGAFPLAVSVPWGVTLGPVLPHLPLPTRVRAEVLAPIEPYPTGPEAAEDREYVKGLAKEIERQMQLVMDRLSSRTGLRARFGLR